jgi:signal transduction histidine kinase
LSSAGALSALATHLSGRKEAILEAWEEAVRADPTLTTVNTLSRNQLRDLIPTLLERFEMKLRGAEVDLQEKAREHGSHRWQQGFSLRGLVREWGHLQHCVFNEMKRYTAAHPGLDMVSMVHALQTWLDLSNESLADTTERYTELRESEAQGVLFDLRSALERLTELDRERASILHEAAHDLRGNMGLVTTTTAILGEEDVPEALRSKAFTVLQESVGFLGGLLEELMNLARLEAGREQRNLVPFDAAVQLRKWCSALEPAAVQRGLFLRVEGPAALEVEGDPAKVQRIVQNLVINAIRYTHKGGVTVGWGATLETDVGRWRVRIQDTGPGFRSGPGSPLADEMREATGIALEAERENPGSGVEPVPETTLPARSSESAQAPGEGIGLLIVKRLCELLDAGLELASTPEGTVFQVVLPRWYSKDRLSG